MLHRLASPASVRYRLPMDQIPIVDTHQHLWDLDLLSLPWLEAAPQLARHHRIDYYQSEAEGHGVAKAVYMEVDVDPLDRPRERDLIGELCRRPDVPTVAGVFGATPGDAGFPATLQALAEAPHAKGARLVLQPPDRPRGFCLQEQFVADVRRLGASGLLFDVCIRPSELSDAAELARRCADTTLILDHCGNADPYIVAGTGGNPDDPTYGHGRQQWLDDIQALGWIANVVCKISGGGGARRSRLERGRPGAGGRPLHRLFRRGSNRVRQRLAGVHLRLQPGRVDHRAARDRQPPLRTPAAQADARERRTHLRTRVAGCS